MNSTSRPCCPQCGVPLPSDALAGLCPHCLMDMNLAPQTQLSGDLSPGGAAPCPPPKPPLPEDLAPFFPALEILECLGRGGMGVVYRARQTELNRVVALKILPREIGTTPGFAERFAREARALAQLNHPGIVTLYEFGRVERGDAPSEEPLYFFLMEYVDGVNLRRLMHGNRVSPREALAIVPQICDALQYAHDQGIVHRDIKPENLLIDRRGQVKVADFGLAKIAAAGEGAAGEADATSLPRSRELTEAGKVMGTPQYMAPEQMEAPGTVDHRADIYALGVVFYQMLTGEIPGKPFEPPSRKVQIDVRLDDVVLRALETDPGRRYAEAGILKTQLEDITSANPLHHPVVSWFGISRSAILGLLWIGLFFLNWVVSYTPPGWALTGMMRNGPFSLVSELLLLLPLMVVGFAAIVGGSIMGIAALHEIRQARSRLPGFALALFDILFFPVILLTSSLAWLAAQISSQIGTADSLVSFLFILIGVGLHVFLMSTAIRMARDFVHTLPPPPRPAVTGTWAQVIRGTALRLGLVTVVHLLLFESLQQLSVTWKESTSELWGIGLSGLTLGGLVWATWPGYRLRRSWMFWAGGVVGSSMALLALVNFYSWHLRPNLGLYQESEWVAQHPAFQAKLQEEIRGNLWEPPEPDGEQTTNTIPFAAPLPEGSVELVALSRYPSIDEPWWAPDGTLFEQAPFTTEAGGGGLTDTFCWYSVVARLHDLPPETLSWTWDVEPRNTWGEGKAVSSDGIPSDELLMISTKQPVSAATANVKIGIASGDWESIARAEARAIAPIAQPSAFGVVAFLPASQTDDGIRVTATHTIHGTAIRLIAFEPNGTVTIGSDVDQMTSESLGHTTATFHGLSLRQAIQRQVEFQVQVRPYAWVAFHPVSLTPGHRTRLSIGGEAVMPGR